MNLYLRPTRIQHQPKSPVRIFTQKNFLLAVIILILFSLLFMPAHAAEPDANPPAQPNGNLCLPLAGGIAGTHEFINSKSGVTYQFDRYVSSTLSLPVPAQLSLYDADTTTLITLTNGSEIVQTLVYSTGDNIWSTSQSITRTVTGIQVKTPATHPSTNLCFWWNQTTSTPPPATGTPETMETPTPVVTPQPAPNLALSIDVLNQPPTGLLAPPEPLTDAKASSEPYIKTGQSATLYIKVMNTGQILVRDVHVSISGDIATEIIVGDIDAQTVAVLTFPVVSHNDQNNYQASAADQSVFVSWRGDSQVLLPLVSR